jgi:iron(III) transport system substrate-binding protein
MKYASFSKRHLWLTSSLWFFGLLCQPVISFAQEINIYSARHYDTDMALYEEFTRRTGIAVNLIEGGSDALIERIVNEGEFTSADMLITVDAGRIWRAQQKAIFQAVTSDILATRIPENLRHQDGFWFGLSKRARVLVYNKTRGLPVEVQNYEDLANPALKGQVCMRSSSNIYNLSLMSSMIEAGGEAQAEAWAKAVVSNFARSPQGNDTAQLRAVASGECGVTVANTYYLGRILGSEDPKNKEIARKLAVIFPNQNNRGSHINISGAGITKYAPNAANALKFLEYLTSDFAQKLFAEGNNEYPILGETTGAVATLGVFKEDDLDVQVLGQLQNQAVRIYDRAGWR